MKFLIILTLLILFLPSQESYCDGILIPVIPEVQVSIKYHDVSVFIDNQIATTKVDQVFINQSPMQIEATYIFPLPEGVAISEFIMYDENGNPLKAELLDSEKAKQIYEDIVRQRKDPAILEYLGTGAFRARVFPIFPWGEKRIQLEYTEILNYSSGICKYKYPLNTEKFSSKPLERVEVSVDIQSNLPIKSIWSPSHEGSIVINREGDNFAKIIYADERIKPDKDFMLYYTISDEDVGINLMTYKELSDDGFFVLMAAPKHNVSTEDVINKNVIFVFDTSGSMAADDKIDQAREALEFCVRKLNSQDSFNIIDFSTGIRKFKPSPIDASSGNIQSALNYIKGLSASGGTNINGSLLEALKQSSSKNPLNMIIFLTDGQPTVEVTDEKSIVKNINSANKNNMRMFVFGVGYDVNTRLLDELAANNHGVSAYVRPGEDMELIVSDFFAKVSSPVLSNLAIDFGAINVIDMYPPNLPDLFAGSQLKVFGRYRNSGNTTIRLNGIAGNKPEDFAYQASFSANNTENRFIPRIWAARKVGYLIDQVRLNGGSPEIIDEIRELSIKYGIVNEYISMLILEDEVPVPESFEWQFADSVGKNAVDASITVQESKSAGAVQSGAQGEDVRIVDGKIFVKRNGAWVDVEHKDESPTISLQYASSAYFNTLSKYPELGKYFALGQNVIVYYDGELYRIQDGSIETIKGDLDGNGSIDLFDLVIIVKNFGKSNVDADINDDGNVNIMDLILAAQQLGAKKTSDASPAPSSKRQKAKLTTRAVDIGDGLVSVWVSIDSTENLYGFQLDVDFDPRVLEAVGANEGTALNNETDSTYWIPPRVDNIEGRIADAACIRISNSRSISSGDLMCITFRLKANDIQRAKKSFYIANVKLSDPNAKPIFAEIASRSLAASELLQNYPNPFNPETWIPFNLSDDSNVAISIFDVNGVLIRRMDLGRKSAGVYKTKDRAAYWDGKNNSGEEVSSGVYFYVLESDNFSSVKKMMLKK